MMVPTVIPGVPFSVWGLELAVERPTPIANPNQGMVNARFAPVALRLRNLAPVADLFLRAVRGDSITEVVIQLLQSGGGTPQSIVFGNVLISDIRLAPDRPDFIDVLFDFADVSFDFDPDAQMSSVIDIDALGNSATDCELPDTTAFVLNNGMTTLESTDIEIFAIGLGLMRDLSGGASGGPGGVADTVAEAVRLDGPLYPEAACIISKLFSGNAQTALTVESFAGSPTEDPSLMLTLNNAVFAGFVLEIGTQGPMTSLSIDYLSLQVVYNEFADDGSLGGTKSWEVNRAPP